MSRTKPSRDDRSAIRRERMQFVLVIGRLAIEALKMLHGWFTGGDGSGWPNK